MLSARGLLRWIAALMLLASCGYVEDKAQQVKERAASEARELKEKTEKELHEHLDDAFGTCDPYNPDTRRNRHRFHELLDTLRVPDARNIYCYTDYMGIDYKVMFSFTCDTSSLARIIDTKDLIIWKDDDMSRPGLFGSWECEWWNEEDLGRLTPFYRHLEEDQKFSADHIFLWYDSLAHRATYQQFSL